jgi:hypothetical protein
MQWGREGGKAGKGGNLKSPECFCKLTYTNNGKGWCSLPVQIRDCSPLWAELHVASYCRKSPNLLVQCCWGVHLNFSGIPSVPSSVSFNCTGFCGDSLVSRPYYQFVGPSARNLHYCGVVMEMHEIPSGKSGSQVQGQLK